MLINTSLFCHKKTLSLHSFDIKIREYKRHNYVYRNVFCNWSKGLVMVNSPSQGEPLCIEFGLVLLYIQQRKLWNGNCKLKMRTLVKRPKKNENNPKTKNVDFRGKYSTLFKNDNKNHFFCATNTLKTNLSVDVVMMCFFSRWIFNIFQQWR